MGPAPEWKEFITARGGRINEWKSVEECIDKCDACVIEPVVQADYTKARQEADAKKGMTPVEYKVTKELLAKKAKSDFVVLHSLPRMDELPMDVDATRHARYWIEAFNGVVCRMALLALCLGKME
jgi:aspartate carbamoyltransferase catalytic subunit